MYQLITELKEKLEKRRDEELERISRLDENNDRSSLMLITGSYSELERIIPELERILSGRGNSKKNEP